MKFSYNPELDVLMIHLPERMLARQFDPTGHFILDVLQL